MSFIIQNGYQKEAGKTNSADSFDYWREVVCDEFVQLACEPYPEKRPKEFSATLRGGVNFSDVNFSEVAATPMVVRRTDEKIRKSCEDDFLMSLQLHNDCVLRQNGREALLKPGSFALYDTTAPYTLNFDQDFHQFIIQMPRSVLARHLYNPEKYTAIAMDAGSGLGQVLKDFTFSLAKELNSPTASGGDVLSENLVSLIALSFSSGLLPTDLCESETTKEAYIRRVLQFIENNLFDPSLNNNKVAESQGISTRYLYQLFRDQNESVREMIMNKRLAAAYELLVDDKVSKHSVESIAYHVGFSSVPHFSRAFKEHYGVSPGSIR